MWEDQKLSISTAQDIVKERHMFCVFWNCNVFFFSFSYYICFHFVLPCAFSFISINFPFLKNYELRQKKDGCDACVFAFPIFTRNV